MLLVGEVHLVRKAGLGDIADGDQEQCGEAIVIACGAARVAIAVVGRKFGGVVAGPFGPAVVFEKEAETRPSAAVTPVATRRRSGPPGADGSEALGPGWNPSPDDRRGKEVRRF